MATLQLLTTVKKLDAVVLYDYLFDVALEGSAGSIVDVTFDELASRLNDYGLTTSRSSAFTSAVVRNNVAYLESLGLVARDGFGRARFDLRVYAFGMSAKRAPRRPRTRSHYENENENGNEDAPTDDYTKEYINTLVNKQINKLLKEKLSEKDSQERSADREVESERATIAETVASVDFSAPKVKKLRTKLAREIYEPGIHSELIDRAVVAVVKKLATVEELRAAVNRAKDDKRLLATTNGFRGVTTRWRSFARSVKNWYDEAGYTWTPTSNRREPAPENEIRVSAETDYEKLLDRSDALRAEYYARRTRANAN